MTAVRRLGWVVAVAAASALALLALRGSLPEEVATHWGPDGRPDGSMGLTTFAAVQAALIVGVGIGTLRDAQGMAALRAFLVSLFVVVDGAIVVANWQRDDWRAARSMPVGLVLVIGAACAGVAMLVRRRVVRPAVPAVPPATLAEGERVVWTGGARNRPLLVAGVVLFAMCVAAVAAGTPTGGVLVPLLVSVTLAGTGEVRVVVSEAGVRVAFAPWRWPRLTVRTAEIVEARAGVHRAPAWGYRGSRRIFGRATVAVRRGPTLELTLADGTHLAVTVDDAETAAELVRGFLARAAGATAGV